MNNRAAPRLGEPASLWRMRIVPVATVMLASALPLMLPLVANSPVLPPLGLLFFLCWQLLRTEMWPVWIGLPLGLWDDLFSGQPIGTAIGLWTLASIAIHYSSQRIYWRGFLHDWAIAALLIANIQSLAALIVHPDAATGRVLGLVVPQIIISALLVPLFMRLTGKFDNFRLKRR
ncbi:rod shape-determining protein MreD [Sphingopyxis sp.]|jgi:rod shape-determining protein MreD|uniref:rod shape-determining protein MreD n=1 Tax=Sphingopyxis sp. TaxID=1908224 RepID=UPI0025F829EF|nr:rod shape-determining protein MreD [Sphingopyxis sp.]MBK6414915.1 rod shape-determining protein MreD [Sphingopyxis sp.]